MIIRQAQPGEEIILSDLENLSMPHPWDMSSLTDLIESENKCALIAFEEEVPAGYVGVSWVLDEAEIGNICVSPDFRRRHIAESILTELFGVLKSKEISVVFLEVESENTPAKCLYDKLGFEVYNTRNNYYGPGKHALLMRYTIS